MSPDGMPPDPFEPGQEGLFAETLAIGGALIDGLIDATEADGLLGLYEAVVSLGRATSNAPRWPSPTR